MAQQRLTCDTDDVSEAVTTVKEKKESWNSAVTHTENTTLHVTAADKEAWNKNTANIATVEEQAVLNRQTLGYECKNLLENKLTSKTSNGVTATVNADGTVVVAGTATVDTIFVISAYQILPKGNYLCNGCTGGSSSSYYIRYASAISASQIISATVYRQYDDDVAITIDDEYDSVYANIVIKNGTTVSDVMFCPMLRDSRITDTTYTPYQPSVAEQLNNKLDATATAASASTIVRETLISGADLDTLAMGEGAAALDYKLFVSTTKAITQTLLNLPPDYPYNGFSLEYIRIAGQQWLQRLTGATYSSTGAVTSMTIYYRAGVGQQPSVTWGGWFYIAPTACEATTTTTTEV